MSEPAGSFSQAAMTLCHLSAKLLHWHPQQFWDATPAEMAAALGLLSPQSETLGFDRTILQTLMERDNER